MMFEKIIHALLPNLEKSKLVDDCRITIDELKTTTIPSYQQANVLFKGFKFKSEEYSDFLSTFHRMSKVGKNQLVPAFHDALENVLVNMTIAQELIDVVFEADLEKMGVTYRKANLLTIMSAGAFFSKYARKWLLYLYILETAQFSDGGISNVTDCLAPAEIEWLHVNFPNFVSLVNTLGLPAKANEKKLADIPEIVVTPENAQTVVSQFGDKVDPLRMRFVPISMNPFYIFGKMFAEMQAKRYNAAKEELRALQLRRLNLEKVMAGKPDAKLQKEIEYIESRINGLNFEIEEMEKKYA